MIRLTDATTLALTKLRTRKIRTSVTVTLSALVFAILIAALSLSQGVFKSLEDFSHEGLNDRYLVMTQPGGSMEEGLAKRPELIERAKQLYDERVIEKKAAAKELGVLYDADSDALPYSSYDGDPKNNRLLYEDPIVKQVFAEYYAKRVSVGLPELKSSAEPYNPSQFIHTRYTVGSLGLVTMKEGREAYPDPAADSPENKPDAILSEGILFADTALTKPFMFDSVNWKPESGRIPVVVTQSGAEYLLDLKPLEKSALAKEKLDRIAQVRKRIAAFDFSACYRNDISSQQINQAVMTPFEIKKNATNPDYKEPAIQYQTPSSDSCAAAAVSKDMRPSIQRQREEQQLQFAERFDAVVRPDQRKVEFQVVGIMPDMLKYEAVDNIDGILSGIVGASSLYATAIPQELYSQLPVEKRHDDLFSKVSGLSLWLDGGMPGAYAVEFNSADDARRFIAEKSCSQKGVTIMQCVEKGKPFVLNAYGSNSVALDDLQNKVTNVLKIAALVAAGIAVVIMGGMIGRTIADGRRETAVFRAIGFKRFDITAVYTVYTLMLSMLVALFALALGLLAAYILDGYYASEMTVKALLSFGASDPTREFHLFALDSVWVWLVGAAIVALGLIAMLIPLLRNIRRNPIRDMRDE